MAATARTTGLFFVFASLIVVACSAFGAESADEENTPAGQQDGSADGSGSESGPLDGALVDGGIATGDSNLLDSSVDANESFFTTFDPPTNDTTPYGWDGIGAQGGAVVLSSAVSVSPPNSLRFEGGNSIFLRRNFAAFNHLHMHFSIRLDQLPANQASSSFDLINLSCNSGPPFGEVRLVPSGNLFVRANQVETAPVSKLPIDTWRQIDFTMDRMGSVFSLALKEGASPVLKVDTPASCGAVDLRLGLAVEGNQGQTPTQLAEDHYIFMLDNVAVDVER